MNLLAKRRVSIVSPQAGTTRDVVEVRIMLGAHFDHSSGSFLLLCQLLSFHRYVSFWHRQVFSCSR
jgi:hypothetical protein